MACVSLKKKKFVFTVVPSTTKKHGKELKEPVKGVVLSTWDERKEGRVSMERRRCVTRYLGAF